MEFLAGNRISGTTAEKDTLQAVTGGWKEVGRTTLGSTTSSIDVTSLPDKRYYMILGDYNRTAGSITRINYNNDTGSNYSYRRNMNGGSDGTTASHGNIETSGNDGSPMFTVGYIANKSNKEKLMQQHQVTREATGASSVPFRYDLVGKWANTSDAITSIKSTASANNYNSGSEVVVLGWDPSDTHSTNFWEQLASVELSSSGDTLSSGTITAKKYLWVQSFTKGTGGATRSSYTMNSDGGNNYGYRYSVDGATDATGSGQGNLYFNSNTTGNTLTNSFIINNSANEKLVISHTVKATSTGASTAPSREENFGKWSNTSSQITSIQMLNSGAGSYDTGSFIKVWGSN